MSLVASISLLTSQSTDMLLRSHKPDTVIWEDATLKLQVQGGQEVVRKQRRRHRGAGEVPQHHHHPAQRPGQPAEGLGVRAAGALAPQHQDIAQGRRQAAAGNKLACLGLNPPGDCTSPVQCRGSNRTSSAPSRTSSSTRQAR